MPRFGTRSTTVLETLHPALRRVLTAAIKVRDFTLIEGYRGRDEQEEYFRTGKTTLHFPDSLHNEHPSRAVDLAPWYAEAPHVRWDATEAFYSLAGFIQGLAVGHGVELRSGGDWDRDGDHRDQSFHDLPHLELHSWPDE
jgi:peptidoglycan L-alanyl-D-glutamate endopeptidase CwlK